MPHKTIRLMSLFAVLASISPALAPPALALPAAQVTAPSFAAPLAANVDERPESSCVQGLPVVGFFTPPPAFVTPVDARYADFDAAMLINRPHFLGFDAGEQVTPLVVPGSIVTVLRGAPPPRMIGIGNVYAPAGGVTPNVSQVEIKNSTVIIQSK